MEIDARVGRGRCALRGARRLRKSTSRLSSGCPPDSEALQHALDQLLDGLLPAQARDVSSIDENLWVSFGPEARSTIALHVVKGL
jgi:hypothetical protein